MIVHDDGSFYLQAGERIPFMCPACGWPEAYSDDAPEVIRCSHCDVTSERVLWEDASVKYMAVN